MMPIRTPEAIPSTGRERERQVKRIFSEIAPRYDLLNHFLSLNVDRRWRRRAVDLLEWQREPGGTYLDACAGTYDLALELARRQRFRGRVVASDFAYPMPAEGRAKLAGAPVTPVCGDSLALPFPDGTFQRPLGFRAPLGLHVAARVGEGVPRSGGAGGAHGRRRLPGDRAPAPHGGDRGDPWGRR